MVGNTIYLIFRHDLVRDEKTLIAPHATFEGAKEHMGATRSYWERVGATTEETAKGFRADFGQNSWNYYVITRTIEK